MYSILWLGLLYHYSYNLTILNFERDAYTVLTMKFNEKKIAIYKINCPKR